jgi:hypothetical protein
VRDLGHIGDVYWNRKQWAKAIQSKVLYLQLLTRC